MASPSQHPQHPQHATGGSAAALTGTGLGARIPALDGLRGIAILLVMLLHFRMRGDPTHPVDEAWLAMVRVGWIGVDLFFVLSGFLITGILVDAKGNAGYFRNFYVRRALRIFPLYYGFLALRFLLLPWLFPASGLETPAAQQAWGWLYLTNVQIALADDFTAPAAHTAHFWSLAVEEQFYLLWPAIVYAATRRQLARVCAALIVAAAALGVVSHYVFANAAAGYVLMPARMDSLAAGALVALLAREPAALRRVAPFAGPVLAASGAALVMLYAWRDGLSQWDPVVQVVGYPVIAAFFATLLVATVTAAPASRLARAFEDPVLRFFGRYSYAMYVFHLPVVELLRAAGVAPSALPSLGGSRLPAQLLFVAAATAATVLAALLSWHLLEKHVLRLKDRFPYAPIPAPVPAAVPLVAATPPAGRITPTSVRLPAGGTGD